MYFIFVIMSQFLWIKFFHPHTQRFSMFVLKDVTGLIKATSHFSSRLLTRYEWTRREKIPTSLGFDPGSPGVWCRDEHALHLLENGHANDNKQIDLSILLIIVMLFSRILFCNASWITVRTDSVFLSHSNETREPEREIVALFRFWHDFSTL